MISTVVAATIMCENGGCGPRLNQTRAAATAISMMVGTNTADTWSASRPIGGLVPWAFFTSSMIRARAVSAPTRVAR